MIYLSIGKFGISLSIESKTWLLSITFEKLYASIFLWLKDTDFCPGKYIDFRPQFVRMDQ